MKPSDRGGIDEQRQMDLADMQSMQKFNDGYRYLLVCIDVFSKYAWVVPLKNKTGLSLVEGFKTILASGRKPEKMITDQGTEFFNKKFKASLKDTENPSTRIQIRLHSQTFCCGYTYRPHVSGENAHHNRKLLRTLSRVETFENATTSDKCGHSVTATI